MKGVVEGAGLTRVEVGTVDQFQVVASSDLDPDPVGSAFIWIRIRIPDTDPIPEV